ESSETLAPAVGEATIVLFDPQRKWASAIRPDDIITINYSSLTRGASASAPPSWTGLVDECFSVADPSSGDGTVTMIYASSFWKWLTTTSVPLQYFFSGQYPAPA